jgi:hypothetical protein
MKRTYKLQRAGLLIAIGSAILSQPAGAQTRATVTDLIAGSAVPLTIKLKELSPDWRRLSITGDAVLGMGNMVQSMMQSFGSIFGGGSSDAVYTRGATLTLAVNESDPGERYLIGYRIPSQGMDFMSAITGMASALPGAGGAGAPAKAPEAKPAVTPESDLALLLINVRSIASIGDIRPFSMEEATRPAGPSLMEMMRGLGGLAPGAGAGGGPGSSPAPAPAPKQPAPKPKKT